MTSKDSVTVSRTELDQLVKAAIADASKPAPKPARGLELAIEALQRADSDEAAAWLLAAWAETDGGIRFELGMGPGDIPGLPRAELVPGARTWITRARAAQAAST